MPLASLSQAVWGVHISLSSRDKHRAEESWLRVVKNEEKASLGFILIEYPLAH